MKNRNIFLIACLFSLAFLTSCKELTCEYSYSPTSPRAGEVVTFTNESTGADDYLWNFGDNGSSTTTSPTHIFCKPGTYFVTLKIVRNKVEKRTRTKQVVVLDTIPAIAMDTDSIYTYTPVKFLANAYNPWKRDLSYQWTLPNDIFTALDGRNMDSAAVVGYFTQVASNVSVGLDMHIGANAFTLTQTHAVYHKTAPSVLYRVNQVVWEHFIYTVRQQRLYQKGQMAQSVVADSLMNAENDTTGRFSDTNYTLASVSTLMGHTITGFQIDRPTAKIYAYSNEGLFVCNVNGAHVRTLLSIPVQAMKVDGTGNRLYWATSTGLYTHRLLQMQGNTEAFNPILINNESQINRLSVYSINH